MHAAHASTFAYFADLNQQEGLFEFKCEFDLHQLTFFDCKILHIIRMPAIKNTTMDIVCIKFC